jgi:sterol 3beta-glucosyltransferase
VALGARLRAEGHAICLVSHGEFGEMAARHGLEFRPVPGSFQSFLASSDGHRALVKAQRLGFRGVGGVFDPFRDDPRGVYRACWDATDGIDGIVCSAVALGVSPLLAERRQVPLALGFAVPSLPTGHLPHPVMPPWPLGPVYNRLTYRIANWLVLRGGGAVMREWLDEANRLSRPSPGKLRVAALVAVSPILVPRPDDWPPEVHVTGFWRLPVGAAAVPDDLVSFIERGDPPICLGFGSMPDYAPNELRSIVLKTLDATGLRAVVVKGSGAALSLGSREDVFEVSTVDYNWLFPRMRLVVHQGGVGTASYCLTAGVPQVTVKYCLDHTFWAWRLNVLGVAPPGLQRGQLTTRALARSIREVCDNPAYGERARALAPAINAEDGLTRAAEVLVEHFRARTPPSSASQI